jgi:hypothetical protein
MIDNYSEKVKNKAVELAFAESGNITVIERRFDEVSGLPVMRPTQETNTKHIDDLIKDVETQIAPLKNRLADLKALKTDVAAKEKERDELIEKKAKSGGKKK